AGVDRVEAAVGVDVLDAGAHVERVVVLLGLLVGVEGLAVAVGPLALAAGAARRAGGGDGVDAHAGLVAFSGVRTSPRILGGAQRHMAVTARPRSTWRRST